MTSVDHLSLHGRKIVLDSGHFETEHDIGAVNTISSAMLIKRDVNREVMLATQKLRMRRLEGRRHTMR